MTEQNYAFVKNGIVENIVIFDNPTEEILEEFKNFHEVDLIIPANEKTIINGTYDGVNFWTLCPFPSWSKNTSTLNWEPPVPYPGDGDYYEWNESSTSWIKMPKGSATPL